MQINRLVIVITLIMTGAVFVSAVIDFREKSALPDFSAYQDVKQKKTAFFDFMLPLVSAQNAEIQLQRQRLEELKHLSAEEYSRSHRRFLEELAQYYRLDVEQVTPVEVQQQPLTSPSTTSFLHPLLTVELHLRSRRILQ